MDWLTGSRLLRLGLAIATLFGASAAVAYATGLIGDDPTITACVSNKDGTLHIVQDARSCSSAEHVLSWSASIPGHSPSAQVFAHFAGGTLDVGRSQGVQSWSRSYNPSRSLATYCVNLRFVPRNVTTGLGIIGDTSSIFVLNNQAIAVTLAGESAIAKTQCPAASAAAVVPEGATANYVDFYLYFSQ